MHFRHAGTVKRSLGRGVSKSALGGMWSRVTSPTYPQIAQVPRRFEFRFAINVKEAFASLQVHSQNGRHDRVRAVDVLFGKTKSRTSVHVMVLPPFATDHGSLHCSPVVQTPIVVSQRRAIRNEKRLVAGDE